MLVWIILFPLIGFLINGIWYALFQTRAGSQPANVRVTGAIASVAIFAAFIVSLVSFFQLSSSTPMIEQILFSWMKVGDFSVDFGLRMDELSSLFALVITGVGTLIHIYSMGYMDHDEAPGKYFAYLNLFCFAMLCLVLGSSLPVMFLGWEGVGLCSYLLIGFWYTDDEKASAGKKAFVVNRIGDLGFILGMFLIYSSFGTLDFEALKAAVLPLAQNLDAKTVGVLTAIGLLLFVGCCGKSAQIPLYVWLPDAMAGPTPVSALIHAATMVTSGIYLVARLSFIYTFAPDALAVVAWVGAITAFFAATMAIAQDDIKKVLAYSTVSQLGYMFLGCGVAAFSAGVFHVITHAFFKALLFMGAGSVIVGMHHEQNIMKMGGLREKMPTTFKIFAAGWLAICGFAPFSGFFSKDEILWRALSSPHGGWALYLIGFVTAVMTAFYMTRLFSLTFLGKFRGGRTKVHESPNVMLYPLIVLAVLSAIGGFMGIPHISWIEHYLHRVTVFTDPVPFAATISTTWEFVLAFVSWGVAAGTMYLTIRLYSDLKKVDALKSKWASIHRVLSNKYFVDEIYEASFVKPIVSLSKALWKGFDVAVIDRAVVGLGRISAWTGQTIRVIQTGTIQSYAVMLLIGMLFTLVYLIYGTR